MSAMGQKRTSTPERAMSALPRKRTSGGYAAMSAKWGAYAPVRPARITARRWKSPAQRLCPRINRPMPFANG